MSWKLAAVVILGLLVGIFIGQIGRHKSNDVILIEYPVKGDNNIVELHKNFFDETYMGCISEANNIVDSEFYAGDSRFECGFDCRLDSIYPLLVCKSTLDINL